MAIKKRLIGAGATAVLTAAGGLAYLFEGEIRTPYVDPVDVLTVCVGDTQNIVHDKLYSEYECTQRFLEDLRTAEKAVNRCTPNLPNGIKPALISFTFNVGQGNYCRSTLARLANEGRYVDACKQLYRWVYAKGKILPGLVRRREAEAKLCLNGL